MWKVMAVGMILAFSACSEDNGDGASEDADTLGTDVEFLPENPEGEYAMRVDPVSWVCQGTASQWPVMYAVASLVEQDDDTFDILSRGVYGFADFSHWGVVWQDGGYFESEYYFEYSLTPGYPPVEITVSAAGSVVDDSLAFINHWLAGWHDAAGEFHTECEIDFDNIGVRRYVNWRGELRSSIDGQWRAWRETLEDSLAGDSAPTRWQTLDVIAQDDDGNFFDLKGTFFNVKNIPRKDDGGVAHTLSFGNGWIEVSGQLDNEYLDLTVAWELRDPVTNNLLWRARDRYTGVPRFAPHVPKQPEPFTGAFNVEVTELFDSCDGTLDARRQVAEVLPTDNAQIQLWIGGIKTPLFAPNAVGEFNFTFELLNNWRYAYWFNEGRINSDTIDLRLNLDVLWPNSGEVNCSVVYAITGDKRYQNMFPGER